MFRLLTSAHFNRNTIQKSLLPCSLLSVLQHRCSGAAAVASCCREAANQSEPLPCDSALRISECKARVVYYSCPLGGGCAEEKH